jgi:hypothetical protein
MKLYNFLSVAQKFWIAVPFQNLDIFPFYKNILGKVNGIRNDRFITPVCDRQVKWLPVLS